MYNATTRKNNFDECHLSFDNCVCDRSLLVVRKGTQLKASKGNSPKSKGNAILSSKVAYGATITY